MADAVGQQHSLPYHGRITHNIFSDPFGGDRGNYQLLPFFFCSTQPAYGAFHPHQLASFESHYLLRFIASRPPHLLLTDSHSIVLTSFLLPILQTALTTTMVTPSVTALPARTIVTANEAIVETEIGIGTGTVAGEKETTVKGTPPTANAQTAATVTGNATVIVSVAAIVRKDARATTKNVDESPARTTVGAPMVTKRAAPRVVVLAEAAAANVTGGRLSVVHPPL